MLSSASKVMLATQSIFMFLAISAVILRIYVRLRKTPPLRADDHLILVALLFSIALAVTNIVGVPVGGFGEKFESLSEEKAVRFFKILFVLQFWYIIAVAFVKLSVLYFYGRIFAVARFPSSVLVMMALTVGWLISFLFATFFQVWPLWCNWIVCKASTNYPVMYVACSVTDIVLDIATLCLPAFFISRLQMNRNKKIGVYGIFGLGIFCVVSSIARLAYAAEYLKLNPAVSYGPSTNNAEVNIILWSGIEACASTICANLPSYSPLITKSRNIESIVSSIRSRFHPHRDSYARPRRSQKTPRGTHLSSSSENMVKPPGAVKTVIEGGVHQYNENDLEMGRIRVHTTVDT